MIAEAKNTMESVYNKLLNSLIEICVVVGADQDTGLAPSSPVEVRAFNPLARDSTHTLPSFTLGLHNFANVV